MKLQFQMLRQVCVSLSAIAAACALILVSSLHAESTPTVQLLSPTDGQTIDGPVVVHIQHSGIRFDGVAVGKAPQPGVGHWHVNIDGTYAGLADTDALEIPNETYPVISTGVHTMTVTFHENNHALTTPPVMQGIKLTYSKTVQVPTAVAGPPTIKLINPGQNAGPGKPIDVQIEHSGIRFDGLQIGKAPVAGVGHWHVYVDGKYAGLGVSNVIEIPNDAVPVIPVGLHTITASLHENNHLALDPPIAQSFQVNLTQELRLGSSPTVPGVATAPVPPSMPQLPNTGNDSRPWVPAGFVMLLILALLSGAVLRFRAGQHD